MFDLFHQILHILSNSFLGLFNFILGLITYLFSAQL